MVTFDLFLSSHVSRLVLLLFGIVFLPCPLDDRFVHTFKKDELRLYELETGSLFLLTIRERFVFNIGTRFVFSIGVCSLVKEP